jgi:hypothetical protein
MWENIFEQIAAKHLTILGDQESDEDDRTERERRNLLQDYGSVSCRKAINSVLYVH